MAIDRYYNDVSINRETTGQLFSDTDLKLLSAWETSPHDTELLSDSIAEVHLLSFTNDYLGSDSNATYLLRNDESNSVLINLREVFNVAGIDRGSFRIIVNLLRPLIGGPDLFPLFASEISPDRREIKFELSPNSSVGDLDWQQFQTALANFKEYDVLNHIVVNFGFNRISKIVNYRFELEEQVWYVRLYDELPDGVDEKMLGWVGYEVIDPYIDIVSLTSKPDVTQFNTLRGPNFFVDTELDNSNSTELKTWEDLLDSNSLTNQWVIDQFLSGSNGVEIPIDYSDFKNYVFYGSAVDRIENFVYKLELMDDYGNRISQISSASGSVSLISANKEIDVYRRRKDTIVSSLSPFEKWLYYEPTGSIFTHDISGSVQTFPKYEVSGSWVLHSLTSSLAQTWVTSSLGIAQRHDQFNYNSLVYSIPDHIRRSSDNQQFEVFLEMIGEHFDTLYSYIVALTEIRQKDEHPQRGMPNEIIPALAESMGWQLQNTKQLADLWLYASNTNQSGNVVTGSSGIDVQPHRNLNYQVWRRVVNNMPYLLKTKGTNRSIRALVSIYGIPHTLLSIKEFGGAPVDETKPGWEEDRYAYKLALDGTSFVEIPRRKQPPSSGSWGGVERLPDTIEFRFGSNHTGSGAMSLYAWELSSNRKQTTLNLAIEPTATFSSQLYSGSLNYGRLTLTITNDDGYLASGSTMPLPVFDGDMWSVQIFASESILVPNTLHLRLGRASDCADGQITHTSSFSVQVPPPILPTGQYSMSWGEAANPFDPTGVPMYAVLGGSTGSFDLAGSNNRFVGWVQDYKEYFEVLSSDTFHSHIKNPGAYHGNSPTSSFYTLHKYYPLGGDTRREDHTTVLYVSSSHPNRNAMSDTTARMVGFSGTQLTQYDSISERYFVTTPRIGGQNIFNEKVRIEPTTLKHELSPERSAEWAKYNFTPIDTNRLMVVFSMTDQVNRDIFNHIGFTNLDDYIGHPDDQYKTEYPRLKQFSREYWQKYTRKYNWNEFIKIFSVFDYTIFEQLRQLIPARADYIGGVLIEPNILERPKVDLIKKPNASNPQYEQIIKVFDPNLDAGTSEHSASLFVTASVKGRYEYLTTELQSTHSLHSRYHYLTGAMALTSSLRSTHHYLSSCIDLYDPYVSCGGVTESIVDMCRPSCEFKRVTYHYSASNSFYPTEYRRNFARFVSMSYNWYYSRSLETDCYPQHYDCSPYNQSRYRGTKLVGLDFNVDSTETVDGGPVVSWTQTNPNRMIITKDGEFGNLKIE